MPFEILEKDLKQYPHFDAPIPADELMTIVLDPERVQKNKFYPFIKYTKQFQPFRTKAEKPEPKRRLIRYASRRDAAIFSYYRYLLATQYEARLRELGIEDCPTAYRKIPVGDGHAGGKCNIDFARDVFEEIATQKDCVVVTLDISKFFECIDHARLYKVWCELLNVESLPKDHLAVFKAITKYVVVDHDALYERLGYLDVIEIEDGSTRKKYRLPFRKIPKQLCSPQDFRRKVMGQGKEFSSLREPNTETFGIPQGAPISDLLANAYLMEFDLEINTYAEGLGGRYWRYSDDIVLVIPASEEVGKEARDYAANIIAEYGAELTIKKEKTSIVRYEQMGTESANFELIEGNVGHNGLEYLGFRFDGKRVFIRDSTLANFFRKITRRARGQAIRHVSRYPGKGREWLLDNFNFSVFESEYGRVQDFEAHSDRKDWTFWTYVKRASEKFQGKGQRMYRQVRNYRKRIRSVVIKEIDRQLEKRTLTAGDEQ